MFDNDLEVSIDVTVSNTNTGMISPPKLSDMANPSPERSLPIVIRPRPTRGSQSSLEVNVSESSMENDSVAWLPTSQSSSLQEARPITPPSGPGSDAEGELTDGIGCCFSAALPPRPRSLTMESEGATDITAPLRVVTEAPGLRGLSVREENTPDTPQANAYARGPFGGRTFGPAPPLTPLHTPNSKRAPSPSSALHAAKRLKISTPVVSGGVEDQAIRSSHVRQRSIDLAGIMGYPGDHSGDTDGPANGRSLTEPFATGQRYCIEFECFSGDEIEQHLAKLLSARTRGTDSVRRILNTFEAIFGSKLSSDKDRSFLLRGREEDVLDLLLTWIREKPIAPGLRREAFEHLSECLEHLGNLPAAPFTKKVLLSVKTRHGSLFTAQLSARELNGAAEWELDAVRDGIREMAEVDIA